MVEHGWVPLVSVWLEPFTLLFAFERHGVETDVEVRFFSNKHKHLVLKRELKAADSFFLPKMVGISRKIERTQTIWANLNGDPLVDIKIPRGFMSTNRFSTVVPYLNSYPNGSVTPKSCWFSGHQTSFRGGGGGDPDTTAPPFWLGPILEHSLWSAWAPRT